MTNSTCTGCVEPMNSRDRVSSCAWIGFKNVLKEEEEKKVYSSYGLPWLEPAPTQFLKHGGVHRLQRVLVQHHATPVQHPAPQPHCVRYAAQEQGSQSNTVSSLIYYIFSRLKRIFLVEAAQLENPKPSNPELLSPQP